MGGSYGSDGALAGIQSLYQRRHSSDTSDSFEDSRASSVLKWLLGQIDRLLVA